MEMKKKIRKPKASTILKQAFALFGKRGERWIKRDEHLEPEESDLFPNGGYCSIGALHKIDTPNEAKAIAYLAFVIKLEKHDFEDCGNDDDVITVHNDSEFTKFSNIRRWFTKAIKLAKLNGD